MNRRAEAVLRGLELGLSLGLCVWLVWSTMLPEGVKIETRARLRRLRTDYQTPAMRRRATERDQAQLVAEVLQIQAAVTEYERKLDPERFRRALNI